MRVLSIQSFVAYGHVGNAAAVFPLQRLGHEVWPVPTVHFSNHTGYGAWRGAVLPADDVREIVRGIADRGVLGQVDVVLSGYQGDEHVAEVVLETVAAVRAANPAATYTCDPVMGDVGRGFFVRPGIPDLMRERVVPAADLITPNLFELGALTGTEPATLDQVLAAAAAARAAGPSTVLVTSVVRTEAPPDTVEMLVSTAGGAWLTSTPLLPLSVNGAGDLTSALFTAHLHQTGDPAAALASTVSSVYAVLEATLRSGQGELRLVAAQDALADPACEFPVQRVA